MGPRLDTIMEGNDVGMAEPLEDLDLAVEVFLQLLVQAGELDRLDGDEGARGLYNDMSAGQGSLQQTA